ncbi:MAG TPA: metallophosphoesterase [Bryobacteraceae bacterium]|nr:metallophosphoesterase [Bryobacteraceae bacterium]
MPRNFHVFPDLIFLIACVAATLALAVWGRRLLKRRWQRVTLYMLAIACIGCYGGGYLMLYFRVTRHLAVEVVTWLQGIALILGICAIGMGILGFLLRRIPFREDRRAMFRAAGAAVMSTPALVTAFGIVHRDDFRVTEVSAPVKGLARDLDGLTLVQLSDIHMSEFLSERQLMRAIDMANETRAKLALVTGDLITRPGDPLDPCLRQIGRLKAEAGVFGCMGNHEGYANVEDYVEKESALMGVRFLRSASEPLRFGNATLNLAGVDYQAFRDPYLVGAEKLKRAECLNVLLSHNPDVFRVASKQGWDLTISGHTHGGQIAVEILHQNISPARYFTPFVRGLYRSDRGAVYVSTGLGTVGLPVRLGAPPEVSLIRLCAI